MKFHHAPRGETFPLPTSEPDMTVEPAAKAEEVPSDPAPQTQQTQPRIPFDQVLRRLVDSKLKKPAPKPVRPPKKL